MKQDITLMKCLNVTKADDEKQFLTNGNDDADDEDYDDADDEDYDDADDDDDDDDNNCNFTNILCKQSPSVV